MNLEGSGILLNVTINKMLMGKELVFRLSSKEYQIAAWLRRHSIDYIFIILDRPRNKFTIPNNANPVKVIKTLKELVTQFPYCISGTVVVGIFTVLILDNILELYSDHLLIHRMVVHN